MDAKTFERRLQALTQRDDNGCLIFLGTKNRKGYGQIAFYGRPTLAHRAAWRHFVGEIPDGMQIDHLCKVTSCVDVTHLEVVTPIENRRRRADVQRGTCARGHAYDGTRGSNGSRRCTVCRRESARRKRAELRAAGIPRMRWRADGTYR